MANIYPNLEPRATAHPIKSSFHAGIFRVAILSIFLTLLACGAESSEEITPNSEPEKPQAPEETPVAKPIEPEATPSSLSARTATLLPEPDFMRHPGARPLANAEETVVAAFEISTQDGILMATAEALSENEWERAEQNSAEQARLLLTQENIFHRHRGPGEVLEYIWVESHEPPAALLLFAGDALLQQFADELGESIHMVIPTRYRVYLFPGVAGKTEFYAPRFLNAHRDAVYPVSLELFELSQDGLQAVGTFNPFSAALE